MKIRDYLEMKIKNYLDMNENILHYKYRYGTFNVHLKPKAPKEVIDEVRKVFEEKDYIMTYQKLMEYQGPQLELVFAKK